jgi:protein-L-isoaspartate(D-aspartate) O-methyltransferase
MSLDLARTKMLEEHLEKRGITRRRVLNAFAEVPREAFVADELVEFAYEDTPLPIGLEQTISQPYIVALTVEALELEGTERVLEVGTGSGYAAAILSRLAREVFSVERHPRLATEASERLRRLGYDNVEVACADGSLGWQKHAPYDAIAVAAGAPRVPQALLEQLAPGGRLVLPVSTSPTRQSLLRITREGDTFREEKLSNVRFVPLVGEQGYADASPVIDATPAQTSPQGVRALLRESSDDLTQGDAALDALVERVGDARVVLLGEATHGTSEFYRVRARITRALIERKGFDFVAVEADWPDASLLNDYVVTGPRRSSLSFKPFTRFPTWMWRNRETAEFIEWLRAYNQRAARDRGSVGFHGLDLYSMFTSIAAVLAYLDQVDPSLAASARERYGSLLPWQKNPADYGQAVLIGSQSSAEQAVVTLLTDLLARRLEYTQKDGARFFDAAQNARLVKNSEHYYRTMYQADADSWNLRDAHMFETFESLLDFYGPRSRGIIWEHNSHVGDATATEMGSRGELNVGQLCRARFELRAHSVGFGTHRGSVMAASSWGGSMREMSVRPSHRDSYEHLFHEVERPAFVLHLREPRREALRAELLEPRLERAIGVVYRPDTELQSHYFHASLPLQFDEYIWLDETHAIEPLDSQQRPLMDLPETYPFGL